MRWFEIARPHIHHSLLHLRGSFSDLNSTFEAMASTFSPLIRSLSLNCPRNSTPSSSKAHASKLAPASACPIGDLSSRRRLLFLLTASTALTARERPSVAQDVPLFGLRKSIKKAEEEAEEIVREGFEAADRGLETAERGLESAERGIEAAEKGIETAEREIANTVNFGGLAQAGVVAGAEVLGVLVATAVVNGIK